MNVTLEGLYLKLDTENYDFLRAFKEEVSAYRQGYQFSAKFASGVWDGKISMLTKKKLPYGLLPEFLRFCKRDYPELQINLSEDVKGLFRKNVKKELKWDFFTKTPAPHQITCVEKAIEHKKGIILSATGSGKSFMMALTIANLFMLGEIKKQLIIVPSTGLILQLRANFIDYGIDPDNIGVVFSEEQKQWDTPIVISTWQSLANYEDKVKEFDSIFVDETHTAQAETIYGILEKASNAKYRLGFTGTLPDDQLLLWKIRAFLGTKLIEISVDYLSQIGWLSDCVIHILKLKYHKSSGECFKGEYPEIVEKLFRNRFRQQVLTDIVNNVKYGTVLMLVEKIADGNLLMENIKKAFPDREVAFVRGSTKAKEREKWRIKANDHTKSIVLIATYPVFQAGVDIPSLAHVVLASPVKSKIRVLQTIGRALRKHHSKDSAHIYDIHDMYGTRDCFSRQNDVKMDFYTREKFTVEEEEIIESPSTVKNDTYKLFF